MPFRKFGAILAAIILTNYNRIRRVLLVIVLYSIYNNSIELTISTASTSTPCLLLLPLGSGGYLLILQHNGRIFGMGTCWCYSAGYLLLLAVILLLLGTLLDLLGFAFLLFLFQVEIDGGC